MKDHVAELVSAAATPLEARNVVREYLQARILEGLQRAGAMVPLAFHGGTALRFLYRIPRYSEELDLALERRPDLYDLGRFVAGVERGLVGEGYAVETRVKDSRTVHAAWLRFPGLLHELRLSHQPRESVAVKIEVDTRPPAGAVLETSIVRRHVLLNLHHHDRASLLAGKLHAILQRPYLKGRDVFDLLFYLAEPSWPAPNLRLLADALRQTGYDGPPVTEDAWGEVVRERLAREDWAHVRADVAPFIEPQVDPGMLTRQNVDKLLETGARRRE